MTTQEMIERDKEELDNANVTLVNMFDILSIQYKIYLCLAPNICKFSRG